MSCIAYVIINGFITKLEKDLETKTDKKERKKIEGQITNLKLSLLYPM